MTVAGIIGFGIALALVAAIALALPSEANKKIKQVDDRIVFVREQAMRLIRENENLEHEARGWKYKYNLELHHKESLQASQTFLSHYLDEANRTIEELQDKLEQLEAELDQRESNEIQEAEGQLKLELLEEEAQ